jgi:hypothetical protein
MPSSEASGWTHRRFRATSLDKEEPRIRKAEVQLPTTPHKRSSQNIRTQKSSDVCLHCQNRRLIFRGGAQVSEAATYFSRPTSLPHTSRIDSGRQSLTAPIDPGLCVIVYIDLRKIF